MHNVPIGTVDIPDRLDRERYFHELDYLELSALYAGPLKPSAIAKWAEVAPHGTLGLVAPWVLTHRRPPTAPRLWDHDATVGDFRDSGPGRVALAALHAAVSAVGARCAIFKSPPLYAPSAANREQLTRFFSEVATAEAVGCDRVWVPDGLWEPRAAVAFAAELGVACAIDPLVKDPNTPHETYEGLESETLYFRVGGLGHAGTIRSERLDDLAALVESYEDAALTIAFDSQSRWNDARNLTKLLASSED